MANEELTHSDNAETEAYITTVDNPWNPQTQYNEWLSYDSQMGYRTLERLAKTIDHLKTQLKTDDEELLYEAAILDMVRLDPLHMHAIISLPKKKQEFYKATPDEKAVMELAKEL